MIDYGASGFVELPSSLNFKVSKLEISYTSIVVDTFAMAESVQFWWTRFPQLTAVYVSPLQDEYQMMWNETYEIYETYETCPFVFVVMARTRSDKYISIKDTAPDGTAQARWVHLLCFISEGRLLYGQVVVVDMHNNNAVNKRPMKAEDLGLFIHWVRCRLLEK